MAVDGSTHRAKGIVASARGEPLIELRGVGRFYSGAGGVHALTDVSLTIERGEFVCVMGPSGSGKSTFMNILGCLDRATSGGYLFRGRPVNRLAPDELAHLRRDAFGFVFQSYNLIGSATAEENVELPALYARLGRAERVERARTLLKSLGLGHRLRHRPSALSGGEQQRVAIGRALMNGGQVLLADEPTGALDAENGTEVLTVLRDLAERGHTVVVITHDPDVAAWAWRRIELVDGRVVADTGPTLRPAAPVTAAAHATTDLAPASSNQPARATDAGGGNDRRSPTAAQAASRQRSVPAAGGWPRFAALREELRASVRSLSANLLRTSRMRTVLTMLSVTVGVWAVVALLSVVQGSYRQGVALAARAGADTIDVRPTSRIGKRRVTPARLTLEDARIIGGLANVRAVLPQISRQTVIRRGDRELKTSMYATLEDVPLAEDWPLAQGAFVTDADGERLAPVAVLGAAARSRLLPAPMPAVGEYVLVADVPFLVKGVLTWVGKAGSRIGAEEDVRVYVPLKTAAALWFGDGGVTVINVVVADPRRLEDTAQAVRDVLVRRHGGAGFTLGNPLRYRVGFSAIEKLLSGLIGAVGAVSLVVGGMGTMSVMLIAVTERRREIGIRMATGARRRDIARQFLLEASAVTVAGGLLGMVLGVVTGPILEAAGLPVAFSPWFVAAALCCAVGAGLVAGFVPARRAARLDPVRALAR